MKKMLLISVLMVFSLVMAVSAACPNGMTGDGGASPCQIEDWDDLQAINQSLTYNYILMNDLDSGTEGYSNYQGGAGFFPLGRGPTISIFSGTFDGQNHTITGLYMNRPGEEYVGIFGYTDLGAEIRNVGIENAKVSGGRYIGPLVGKMKGGTVVENCYSINGFLNDTDLGWSNIGGLVGDGEDGYILNSYADAIIYGAKLVGGLTARVYQGTVLNNSYSTSDVIGESYIGGLVGYRHGQIVNSFSTGSVNYTGTYGGSLLGGFSSGTITNSYWNNHSGNPNDCYNGGNTGCTAIPDNEAWFYNSSNPPMDGWDFTNVWQEETNDYPTLLAFAEAACTDSDSDGFGYPTNEGCTETDIDNCPATPNLLQGDADNDTIGDLCDDCPATPGETCGQESASEEVNASDGGIVETPSGDVNITIPADALSEDETIVIEDTGTYSGDFAATWSAMAMTTSNVFGPSGTTFTEPVEVCFTFDTWGMGVCDDEVFKIGKDADDDETYEEELTETNCTDLPPGCSGDCTQMTLCAETDSFSNFVVFFQGCIVNEDEVLSANNGGTDTYSLGGSDIFDYTRPSANALTLTAKAGYDIYNGTCGEAQAGGGFTSSIAGASASEIASDVCINNTANGDIIELQDILFSAVANPRTMTFDVTGNGDYCNSELVIWDESEGSTHTCNSAIYVYANYTNKTDGSLVPDADCTIEWEYSSDVYSLVSDGSLYINNSMSYGFAGNMEYNIMCTHPDFANIIRNESIRLTGDCQSGPEGPDIPEFTLFTMALIGLVIVLGVVIVRKRKK